MSDVVIPIEIPPGVLAASTRHASGWILLLTRGESVALLRASERFRDCDGNRRLAAAADKIAEDVVVTRDGADLVIRVRGA